jgi:hypothetical protein
MAPGVAQRAAIIFSYMSDLPRLARMQTCHVEVEGVVMRHSPAEALAVPWGSLPHADRLNGSVRAYRRTR